MITKKEFKNLIKENAINEVVWMKFCQNVHKKRDLLIQKGYRGRKLDESFSGFLDGLVRAFFGSGLTTAISSGDDVSGAAEKFKGIALQQFYDYFVTNLLGFEKGTMMNSIARNAIESTFNEIGPEGVKSILMKGDADCFQVAEKASVIFVRSFYEGLTEGGLEKILDKMLGDFEGLKKNKLFGGVYIEMREKISDIVTSSFGNESELAESVAEMLCDGSLADAIIDMNPGAIPKAGDIYQSAVNYFGV